MGGKERTETNRQMEWKSDATKKGWNSTVMIHRVWLDSFNMQGQTSLDLSSVGPEKVKDTMLWVSRVATRPCRNS